VEPKRIWWRSMRYRIRKRNSSGRVYPRELRPSEVLDAFISHKKIAFFLSTAFVAFGYLLCRLNEKLYAVPYAKDLWAELGMAIMVAGVVGLGIEVYALSTGRFRKELEYEEHLETLESLARSHIIAKEPLSIIQGALPKLFPGKKYEELVDCLSIAIENIYSIKTLEDRPNKLTEVEHIMRFLAWATDCFVADVANQMQTLIATLHANRSCTVTYTPPDRFALNRRLLEAQMRGLKESDRYDSLANVRLYTDDRNDSYLAATREMLKDQQVSIRRIFNVCCCENQKDTPRDWRHAKEVIERQIDEFKDCVGDDNEPRFRVGILTTKVLRDSAAQIAYAIERLGLTELGLTRTYFGVFYHGKKQVLLFESDPGNQATLRVTAGGPDHIDIVKKSRLFEALWGACEGADSPFVEATPAAPEPAADWRRAYARGNRQRIQAARPVNAAPARFRDSAA
jgi:hypothetical protein